MRHLRQIVPVLLVALVALVATGCGAADKQEYIKANNKIQQEVAPKLSAGGTDAAAMDSSIKAIDDAIDEFSKLDVPADYKKPHDQMVEALGELRDELKELKATKDVKKLTELQSRVAKSQEKYNDAITKMNDDRL